VDARQRNVDLRQSFDTFLTKCNLDFSTGIYSISLNTYLYWKITLLY